MKHKYVYVNQWGCEVTIWPDGEKTMHQLPLSNAVVSDPPGWINDRMPGEPKNTNPSCPVYYSELLLEPPTKGMRPIRCAACGRLIDSIHHACRWHLCPSICRGCRGES